MGLFGTIRNTVKEAAERTGLEEEVDQAEDVFQSATGVDAGGSGGGPNDQDTEKQGKKDPGNKGDNKGAADKAVDKAKDAIDRISGGGSDSSSDSSSDNDISSGGGGGSSSGSKSSSPDTGNPKNTGSSGSSSTQKLQKRFFGKKTLPDKKETIDKVQKSRGVLNEKIDPFTTQALEAKEKAIQAEERIEKNIEKIREAPENARFTFGSSEKAVSKSEAINRLEKEDTRAEKAQERITRKYEKAANMKVQRTKSREQRVSEKADQIIFGSDDDSKTLDVQTPKSLVYAETLASNKGFEFIASSIPGGKNPDDVAKERIASDLISENPENFGRQAKMRLGSPVGVALTSYLGGAAFSATSKGLATVSGTASTTFEAAGAAAGVATVALEGGKAVKEFRSGDTAEAVGDLGRLTVGTAGFLKGSKAVSSSFSPKLGRASKSRSVSELEPYKVGSFENTLIGRGKTEVTLPYSKKGFTARKPYARTESGYNLRNPFVKTERGTVEAQAGYRVLADRTTAETKGRLEVNTPSGKTRSSTFETFSTVKGRGETASGSKTVTTKDTIRTRKEGKLFEQFNDRTTYTRSIKESESQLSGFQKYDLGGSIKKSGNLNARILEYSTLTKSSKGRENFGEALQVVKTRESGSSGSGMTAGTRNTGSGGGGQTKTGGYEGGQVVSTELLSGKVQDMVKPDLTTRQLLPSLTGGSGGRGRTASIDYQGQNLKGSTQEYSYRNTSSSVKQVQKPRQQFSGTVSGGPTPAQTTKIGQGTKTDTRSITGITSGQQFKQDSKSRNKVKPGLTNKTSFKTPEKLKQVPGLKTKTAQRVNQRTRLRLRLFSYQKPKTRFKQVQKLDTRFKFRTPTRITPKYGFTAGLKTGKPKNKRYYTADLPSKKTSVDSGIDLDILSANLAAQSGNKARFEATRKQLKNLDTSAFSGGLKTTAELTGKARKPELFDSSSGYKELY